MDKHIVAGGAIGMVLFAALDTFGLIMPFVETETDAEFATFLIYGGGIVIGMICGEVVRRVRAATK